MTNKLNGFLPMNREGNGMQGYKKTSEVDEICRGRSEVNKEMTRKIWAGSGDGTFECGNDN